MHINAHVQIHRTPEAVIKVGALAGFQTIDVSYIVSEVVDDGERKYCSAQFDICLSVAQLTGLRDKITAHLALSPVADGAAHE